MAVDQAWEAFAAAIRSALVSDTSLQERVEKLLSGVLHLQRESFPDERVWEEYRKLVNETAKREPRNQGDAASSRISDEKARQCLAAAFDIFSQLAKAFGRTEFVI